MESSNKSTEITFGNEAQEDARLLQELREENGMFSAASAMTTEHEHEKERLAEQPDLTNTCLSGSVTQENGPLGINRSVKRQTSIDVSGMVALNKEQSKEMSKLVLETLAVTPNVDLQASLYESNSESLPLVQEMEAAATSVDGYPSIQIPNLQDIAEQDERSVYVGNVDYSCDALDLVNFFKGKVSKIFRVTIVTNKFTGSPMGFAYIELGSVDDVMSAMELNNCLLKDRKLNIQPKRTNFPGFQRSKKGLMSLKGELSRSKNGAASKHMIGSQFLKMIENRAKALNKANRSSRTARPGSFNVGSFSQKNTKSFRFK
ncbi:hypothetical protein ACO0QE_000571 [Hanseniaspora vineae]